MDAQIERQAVATDGQVGIAAGDVGQAQVPAEGIGRDVEDEILELAGRLVGDGLNGAAAIETHRRGGQFLAGEHKASKRAGRHVNADIPDVRLMAGTLQEAAGAGVIHIGLARTAGAVRRTAAPVPPAWNSVAP